MRAPGYISAVGKGRVHKARSSRQFPVGIFAKKLYIGKGKKEVRIWESKTEGYVPESIGGGIVVYCCFKCSIIN